MPTAPCPSGYAVYTIKDIMLAPDQSWKLSNTALKSMRDTNEDPPGRPIVWGVPLLDEPHQFWVPTLYRTKGTDYTLGGSYAAVVMAIHAQGHAARNS